MAVRQVILSPSAVKTSARTVYVPCNIVSIISAVCRFENTHRRDLPGQIDILGQAHLALLERAVEISLLDRVAAVCVLVDERDEAVLDLEMHLEALADLLFKVTCCLD